MQLVKKLRQLIKKSVKSALVKESGRLYIAEGIGMGFAFLVLVTRSKLLTVNEVGLIDYIVSLVSLTSAFFNFGLDNTAARVVLNEKTVKEKEKVAGTAFLVSAVLTIVYGLVLAIINFTVPLWGHSDMQALVYMIIPFAGYNIVLLTYKQVCFASGNIKEASIQLYISYVIYWIVLLVTYFFGCVNVQIVLVSSYAINFVTVIIPIVIYHKSAIRLSRCALERLWSEQRERGWKIYFSRVFLGSTFNLDTLILGIFHPLDTVAHYTITKYIAMPVSMVGNSVSQSVYRQYAKANRISKKLIWRVLFLTVVAAGTMLFCGFVVAMFLGDEYKGMLRILPLSIMYSIVSSVNAMYNSFMNAKGMAEELKHLAIIGALANLICNLVLIIPFGAIGGVWARLVVVAIVLCSRVYYCRKYEKTNNLVAEN